MTSINAPVTRRESAGFILLSSSPYSVPGRELQPVLVPRSSAIVPFSATTGFSIDFAFRFDPPLPTAFLPLELAGAGRDPSPARAASGSDSGVTSGCAGGFSTASPTGGRSSERMNARAVGAGETLASSLGATEPAALGPRASVTLLNVLVSGCISRAKASFSIPPRSFVSLPTPSLLSGLPIVFRGTTVRMAERVTFPAWAVIVAVPTELPSTLKVPVVLLITVTVGAVG